MEANPNTEKLTFPPIPHYWGKVLVNERLRLKYPPPKEINLDDVKVYRDQTLIEFLEHEQKGWIHLKCTQKDLSNLSPWQLQRAWPADNVNEERFWEAHKRRMNVVEGQILKILASEPERLPAYILLNLKVYEKMDVFSPNCLFPGRNWKEPQNIIDLFVYFEAFNKLKGWRLPVPPLHSRESYSPWYMEKVLPGTSDQRQTLMAIKEREQQARYATFLRCLQKTYPIEFSDLMSFPIDLFGFLFKQFVTRNGYPEPSYSLIENYYNELSHPYFCRKIDIRIFQCPVKQEQRAWRARVTKNARRIQGDDVSSQEEEAPKKEEKKRNKTDFDRQIEIFEPVEPDFRKEWEEMEGCNLTLQRFDEKVKKRLKEVVRERMQEERKKANSLTGFKKMQAQIKIENQEKEGLIRPVIVKCERVEELMQQINPSVSLSRIITEEKKRFGIDYSRSPIDPLNPQIFRFKKKNTVTYYGCPGCGQWRKKGQKCNDCHNCELNNVLLSVQPRTSTIPFAIQLMRSNTKHGLALCMLCHQCFSSRGESFQHQCPQLKDYYERNPQPSRLYWGMNPKRFGVVLSKEQVYVMPIFMEQEQPLRPNMKLNPQIKAYECSPQLFAFQIKLLSNDLPLRQTMGGVIALGDIEKGTKFGPIGGDIFPHQAYDFFPETSSIFNSFDNTTYTFVPIQNFIGISFAQRGHQGSRLEPNCEIMFGYVKEKGHIRAFVKATKLICRGQAIIINRNMPTVSSALRLRDESDVVPCSSDGMISSLVTNPRLSIESDSSSISIRIHGRPNIEEESEEESERSPMQFYPSSPKNVDYKPNRG